MLSFSKDTLHCPKIGINDKKWPNSNSTCTMFDAKKMSFLLNLEVDSCTISMVSINAYF